MMDGLICTATATRKFDGVMLQYLNKRLELKYEGGLGANYKLSNRPLDHRVNKIRDDISVPFDFDESLT